MLLPLLVAAVVAAIGVSAASFQMGKRWAIADVRQRFIGIEQTLRKASFPLTPSVLNSLADLTATEFVTLNASGSIVSTTLDLDDRRFIELTRQVAAGAAAKPIDTQAAPEKLIHDNGKQYLAIEFLRTSNLASTDGVARVMALFDNQRIAAASRRATMLPLATGLSTVILLTVISAIISRRLVQRLIRLQQRVEQVAGGDFQVRIEDASEDEIGRLGNAVDSMAEQLEQLWKTVTRQQSEKLLHQIAGGMAHQLRNTLTGARMAIELHAANCTDGDQEGIDVAIHQIETAEDYVHRLLLVASGRQHDDRPMLVGDSLSDLRHSLSPIARHLHVDLEWVVDRQIETCWLRDGPSWIAATTNLVHNALQSGKNVRVSVAMQRPDSLVTIVTDDGPGVPDRLRNELFQPFVTSKPEGMGLGLSVVKRAAEYHEGDIQWRRIDGRTEFEFTVKIKQDQ